MDEKAILFYGLRYISILLLFIYYLILEFVFIINNLNGNYIFKLLNVIFTLNEKFYLISDEIKIKFKLKSY